MINADPAILKEFRQIPGVGKSIAMDLWNLGYRSLDELRDENPDDMYSRLEKLAGCHVDRCMLYVFRCAVYYVSNDNRDPELEKWWNWKD
ncbi:helix-hairpin-helix domain-containing protein [Maridesulfovibrio sp.]|uniref:helix-hairpin-helix domain-containing protein n=1 Tax=Maridesulfovibrio sp. TaxID=2795000 RepID=UPI0039EF397F